MHTIRDNASRSTYSKKIEPEGKDNDEVSSDTDIVADNKCTVGTQTYRSDLVSLYKIRDPKPTAADLWAGEATKLMSLKHEVQATQTTLSFRAQEEGKYPIVIKGLSKIGAALTSLSGQVFVFCILLLSLTFAVVQLCFVKFADILIEARELFYTLLEKIAGKPGSVLELDQERVSYYLNMIDYDLPAEEDGTFRLPEKKGGALLEANAEQFPGKPAVAAV